MASQQTFNIFVDWGTTNLRAYLVTEHGQCVDELHERTGVKNLHGQTCQEVLDVITAAWRVSHKVRRVLLVGMVGSEIGWTVVPLIEGPCGITQTSEGLVEVDVEGFQLVQIVPGVRTQVRSPATGMMRGEEVQVFGSAVAAENKDMLVCLPGSHSKWVLTRGSEIKGISTFMTGELFQVLREHSVLKESLATGDASINDHHFREGLKAVQSGESILKLMFSVRIEKVCDPVRSNAERLSFLSGVLIGAEVMAGLKSLPDPSDRSIVFVGNGVLAKAYETTFQFFDCNVRTVDVREAFLKGCQRVLECSPA